MRSCQRDPSDKPVVVLSPAVKPCRGFTLLELMVVLVLIGIIFSFAVLSIRGDELAETMEQETRRLATLIGMASDEAVTRGEELAIHFSDDSYAFLVLRAGDWQPDENDRLLKTYRLPAGLRLRLEVEGETPLLQEPDDDDEDARLVPQVYILSSGEMTPFSALFEANQSRYRYHLSASLLGELDWEKEEIF
jgi:general secretion pathway protein H